MATRLSVSESFTASVIFNKQLTKQSPQLTEPVQEKRVPIYIRILLTSALFTVEAGAVLSAIYGILLMQYLGTPVSMVGLPGAICGTISIVLLPIIGSLSDRGTNQKARKIACLLFGGGLFVMFSLILMTSAFLKMGESKASFSLTSETSNDENTSSSLPLDVPPILHINATLNTEIEETQSGSTHNADNEETQSGIFFLSLTAYLGMLAFTIVDAGYDMGLSLTRAYSLQCLPAGQHTDILVTSALMQAVGGTLISFIGMFDFPDFLANIFGVEGMPAFMIMISCVMLLIVILTFTATILTGQFYDPNLRSIVQSGIVESLETPLINKQGSLNKIYAALKTEIDLTDGSAMRRCSRNSLKRYNPDILHTEHGVGATSKRPSFVESSMSYSNSFFIGSSKNTLKISDNSFDLLHQCRDYQRLDDASDDDNSIESNHADTTKLLEPSEIPQSGMTNQSTQTSHISERKTSFLQSCSLSNSQVNPLQRYVIPELIPEDSNEYGPKSPCPKISGRMAIILCSTFLATGSLLGCNQFYANSITIGIYHGDPEALPGSEGRELYETGLRTASIGNLVAYSVYMVLCCLNGKLFELLGEKLQFVVSSITFIVSNIIVFTTLQIEWFYVYCVFLGLYRGCVFTVLFVLANKCAYETGADGERPKVNIGQIMSLTGVLIPAHYVLLSAAMGPLMDWTGDVWVPQKYSAISGIASLLVFSLLFFMKK